MTVPSHHIYIVGAQNTGKTTLVNALQAAISKNPEESQPQVIKEVARNVLVKYDFTAEDIRTSPVRAFRLQQLILQAQFVAERAILQTKGWFIADRSGADPIVYARKYVSEEASKGLTNSTEWLELRDRMMSSTIIVCEAGADWLLDDGVRLMPDSRKAWIAFDVLFRECLDEWGLSYEVLPCTLTAIDERVEFVMERWRSNA